MKFGNIFFILLVLFSALSQGLYYQEQFYIVTILSIIFFVSLMIQRKANIKGKSLLILTFFPFIQLASQLKLSDVIEGWIYLTTYLIIFVILINMKNNTVYTFYSAGILIGILTVLNPSIENNRLGGVFEYANTSGVVFISFFLFGVIQYIENPKKSPFFWLTPLFPFLLIAYASGSKATLLLFIMFLLITLCFYQIREQFAVIVITMIASGMVLITAILQYNIAIIIILFISAPFLLYSHRNFLKPRFKLVNSRLFFPLLYILTILLSIVSVLNKNFIYTIFPIQLKKILSEFSLSEGSFADRIIFLKDGLALAQSAPWLGHGRGGWSKFIFPFQSEPYQSLESHNGYLDVLIDYGIIGLGILCLLLLVLFVKVVKNWSTSSRGPFIFISIILLHSSVDFDLKYGLVVILLLWALSLTPLLSFKFKDSKVFVKYYLIFPLFILLIITTSFSLARLYYEARDTAETLEQYEKRLQVSTVLNPINRVYAVKYLEYFGKVYEQTKLEADLNRLLIETKEVEKQFIQDPIVQYEIAEILSNANEKELSLIYLDRAISLNPYYILAYESAIQISSELVLLKHHLKQPFENDLLKLESYVLSIERKVSEINSREKQWKFHVNAPIRYSLAILYFNLGEYDKALIHTKWIRQSNTKAAKMLALQTLEIEKLILNKRAQNTN